MEYVEGYPAAEMESIMALPFQFVNPLRGDVQIKISSLTLQRLLRSLVGNC